MFSRILLPLYKQNFQIERVKFGVPLDEVCTIYNDIPGPLLILILKLNKEAPYKKDVFRAPGHQSNMKKLIHNLQTGRLVNIDNYTVYTIASVLKKFLRKLPGGIFSSDYETQLFNLVKPNELNLQDKQQKISHLISSLPLVNQHLLVLLFGTFNAIANCAQTSNTGMTSEAIGVSVAPSFFHSCVPIGLKVARMEDVERFKLATLVTKFLIDNFGVYNLFGKENYEYYAKISGRLLHIQANLIFAYKYPLTNALSIDGGNVVNLQQLMSGSVDECQSMPTLCNSTSRTMTGQQQQTTKSNRDSCASNCEKSFTYLLNPNQSPTQHSLLINHPHSASSSFTHHSLNQTHQHTSHPHNQQHYNSLSDDIYTRLSMSMEDNVFKTNNLLVHSSSNDSTCNTSTPSTTPSNLLINLEYNENMSTKYDHQQINLPSHSQFTGHYSPSFLKKVNEDKISEEMIEEGIKNLDQLKIVNRYAESTKSLSFLPEVHERQTARMKTRSQWFLNPNEASGAESEDELCTSKYQYSGQHFGTNLNTGSSSSSGYHKESGVNSTRAKTIIRKTSLKEKRLIRRSSSKKDKENGNNLGACSSNSGSNVVEIKKNTAPKFGILSTDQLSGPLDNFASGSSYKPRI